MGTAFQLGSDHWAQLLNGFHRRYDADERGLEGLPAFEREIVLADFINLEVRLAESMNLYNHW
jgi:hypothetical protein